MVQAATYGQSIVNSNCIDCWKRSRKSMGGRGGIGHSWHDANEPIASRSTIRGFWDQDMIGSWQAVALLPVVAMHCSGVSAGSGCHWFAVMTRWQSSWIQNEAAAVDPAEGSGLTGLYRDLMVSVDAW